MPTAIVIGAGFSGISAATTLASRGWQVRLMDRHAEPGGRAGSWHDRGFTFDMGPSFYWMPDVFERWFQRFGERVEDHLDLRRLDPGYSIVFGADDVWRLPAGREMLRAAFERVEAGAGAALDRFLADAKAKYDLGINDLVYRPSLSWTEYINTRTVAGLFRRSVFRSMRSHVKRYFRDDRLRQVMEFPVLFLGGRPQDTPALYSLMNHADMALGTWYPMGGMTAVVKAMLEVALAQGVEWMPCTDVKAIVVEDGRVRGVKTEKGVEQAELVVATADYHHVEQDLLQPEHRSYSKTYWDRRVMAPGALLFFIGLERNLDPIGHHTLFFDQPLDEHTADIYDRPRWPRAPLFHVSCTSHTDPATAPPGCTNLTVLIPIAAGLDDGEPIRERYFDMVMARMEEHLHVDLRTHVRVKRSYCLREQVEDHRSFRGNAYGLAGTLGQTGPGRPRIRSRKVKGLYFAGQLTVPGPGVPPALISGQVAADLAHHDLTHRS